MARRNHTQTSLASKLNRSQQFLSRRLSGQVPFDIEDLLSIATALDIELAELLDTAA
jgi:transcriptional regulator with XRE-family HTH domain